VADVTDFGRVQGLPYLVMSLLVGDDLANVFAQRGRLSVTELVDIALPVSCAVAVGHDQGIIHRDLKPANIFLHREGGRMVPKLLDFGVSRMLGTRRITVNASVFGTPHYMAPEQARGDSNIDPRADQYALGVILYEGVTGRLPREAEHAHALLYSVAFGSFLPPSAHAALPAGFESVILKAMERDPRRRFGSMREMAAALLPYASFEVQAAWAGLLGWPELRRGGRNTRRPSSGNSTSSPSSGSVAQRRAAEVLDVYGLFALLTQQPSFVLFALSSVLALLILGVYVANSWFLVLYPALATLAVSSSL
jgi:serine/threonine-protein kinase